MGVAAAELVEVAVLGIDEFFFDLRVGMAGAAAMDDEMHIGALFIHIAQARRRIVIAAAFGREMHAHEGLKLALGILARRRLAEIARFGFAPAFALAETIAVMIGRLALFAGHADQHNFAMVFQIRDELQHLGREMRTDGLRRGADVGVGVVNLDSITHQTVPSLIVS